MSGSQAYDRTKDDAVSVKGYSTFENKEGERMWC
jgi:hypothetical protein